MIDKYILLSILLPPICGLVGFLLKYILERTTEKRLKLNKHSLDRIELKLKTFYQPILTNLLRENTIFKNLIKFDSISDQMITELDKEILNIHLETQQIIQRNIVDVNPKDEILEQLEQYDHHVLIFELLRKYKDGYESPKRYNVPYPQKLQQVIADEIRRLKQKQKLLIGDFKEYKASINSAEPIN